MAITTNHETFIETMLAHIHLLVTAPTAYSVDYNSEVETIEDKPAEDELGRRHRRYKAGQGQTITIKINGGA